MIANRSCLSIQNLSFQYPGEESPVIENFSCVIPLQTRVAILGLNGSGKSTLLNLMLGILKPNLGQINLVTDSISRPLASLNGSVGFLPQIEKVPFDYSVKEYVLMGRSPTIPVFSTPSQEDRRTVNEVLGSLDMLGFRKKRLEEISGGELQRVRLARIMAQEPELILMDEPATHLDIKNKKSLYQLINGLTEEGKTIIFSNHDPVDIGEYSDYCIVMSKKKNAVFVKTSDLLGSNLLSTYFETPIKLT